MRKHVCPVWVRAFTLVELLVVIVIIALLIAILLPSLARAREQAKVAVCLGNLHDIIAGSIMYANSDTSGYLIPVTSTVYDIVYLSASRRSWGGKSGLHFFNDEAYPELPASSSWHQQGDYGMWSMKNGMGPDKRPLNRFIYKSFAEDFTYQQIKNMSVEEAQTYERLEFDVYRCPSDVGWVGGDEATHKNSRFVGRDVIFGYGGSLPENTGYKLQTPLYDGMGNSYATDSVITSGEDALGAYMRKYEAMGGSPSRVITYLEGKGFYGCFWNSFRPSSAAGSNEWTYGNHGVKQRHNVVFADGHANPVLYEVADDVLDIGLDYVVRGPGVLRGGKLTITADRFNPSYDIRPEYNPTTWYNVAHLLMDGPGWQNHTQPSPAVKTSSVTWVD